MYMTLRVRLKMSKEIKGYLTTYERLFHEEIIDLSKQLENGLIRMNMLMFHSYFHPALRWQLYQLARKQHQANCSGKTFCYSRSSSWKDQSFEIIDDNLYLNFGSSFYIQNVSIKLIVNEKELNHLRNGKLIRIDLVHDEKYWFANFIIKYFKE